MDDKTNDFFTEYLSGLCLDFDESTLISPNKNGEKENGIIEKSEYVIKEEICFFNSGVEEATTIE